MFKVNWRNGIDITGSSVEKQKQNGIRREGKKERERKKEESTLLGWNMISFFYL